ncbi:response regulator transcription factor [Sphaerochaeta halotolerans]|uniref:response regulator transcription factor n=1 Tax=Sphaerochaeta halotolerans TaxID=2293840 RepID=UPI0013680DF6|nr:response regulator transcription factor [Sphaerochaeta halotolerans]MXI85985.1 response regulator [Sphaerochaeta halotolerans]
MIYVVEDNHAIAETIQAYLQLAGYTTEVFGRCEGVMESLEYKYPRLCILDVMLPDGDGFLLAKQIHAYDSSIPFIFLTARESESDRITGLELGSEDYIIKPFSPKELVLRVQAILRRVEQGGKQQTEGETYTLDGHTLELNEHTHEVILDGKLLSLTALEWKMLLLLAENSPQLITRQRLLGECLGYVHDGSDRTINTHMKNLRSKLGSVEWIKTVRGFGYAFAGKRKDT